MLSIIMNWYIMLGKRTWIKIKRKKWIEIEIKDRKIIKKAKIWRKSKDRLNKKSMLREYRQEVIENQQA